MKNVLKFIVFTLVAGLSFNSCEKDTFTEEDAMQALQKVDLIITVTDKSNFDLPVDSATVSTVIDGVTVEKLTDASGMVSFKKAKIGEDLNVYVSKENYTKTFTTINTTPANYRQSAVSANVYIYSLADENLVTVKGQLTIETDLTNRTKEVVVGSEVRVFNQDLPNGSVKAFIGKSDKEGKYEIKVPVNATGNDHIYVRFQSIDTIRTAGVDVNNKYSVETQNAFYDIEQSMDPTDIPAVPSALISIDAPASLGTGFTITSEIETSSSNLTSATGGYDEMKILKKGSGYFPNITGSDTTVWVFFSPDTKGLDTARVQLTFKKDGGLVSINDLVDYGVFKGRFAEYSTKPTIDLNIGGGTGAEIFYNFGLIYTVLISNNGSGYINVPSIRVTKTESGIESTITFSLSPYAFIANGSIYSKTGNDILFEEGQSYESTPTYTVVVDEKEQALLYMTPSGINTDGTLDTESYSWISKGNNYDPANPPKVTVTSIAGYGSGAEFKAEVLSTGVINKLNLIQPGDGYVRNINDFRNYGTVTSYSGDYAKYTTSYFYNALPGATYTVNAYYGTGYVTNLK